MRLCAALAAGVSLGADAASPATLALWPQHLDAKLSLSRDAEGLPVVEASHGGALGTFNSKLEAHLELPLDPLIENVEIVWVPPTDEPSSVFDRIVVNSPRFAVLNAVGVHLQVNLAAASWDAVNETLHARIEDNVRGVLTNTLPTLEILPSLSKGFLAKSLCDFHSWRTSDPLAELYQGFASAPPSSSTPRICYSSSFPFVPASEEFSFYDKVIHGDNIESTDSRFSTVESAILDTKRGLTEGDHRHRLAVVQLGRSSTPSPSIEVGYLEAWIANPKSEDTWRTTLPMGDTEHGILVVTAVSQDTDRSKFEYFWIQEPVAASYMPESLPSFEIQPPKVAVSASAQAAIVGDGFHRRYTIDLKLLEPNACGDDARNKTILVRVPISRTSYLDLDEIRRMERFGELKLLAFSKHIEIERPSPVSSQHVVGLEFAMSSESDQVHVEYPIHFRYQTPSEVDLYRQASVIAPEVFLFCPSKAQSAAKTLHYLQTWGVSDSSDPAVSSSGSRWLRLSLSVPLPAIEVLTPVGYLPSDWIVSSATLLFASLGAALLLWVSVTHFKSSGKPAEVSWKAKLE